MANSDELHLAARVANVFSTDRGLAYAQIDSDLKVRQTSANFPNIVTEPTTNFVGKSLPDLLWEFVGGEETLHTILAGRETEYILANIQREQADGSIKFLTLRVVRLDETSTEAGLLLIVEDTTATGHLEQWLRQERNELRLIKEQLIRTNDELDKLNHFKSFLLSMVAHDMRTPLTAVSGYADLLIEQPAKVDPAAIKSMLVTMRRQANQLKLLIANLLDLGQIEQGQLRVTPHPCDLNAHVTEVAQATAVVADQYGLNLTLDLAEDELCIYADPSRIRQILQNLIDNAVKYTQRNGTVWIRTWLNSTTATVQIEDTGRGMTEDQVANLFQLYYRADESDRSKAEGSGLGLYIVKTLVEAHQGRIEVVSRRNQGTKFSIHFPINLQPPTTTL